VSGPPQVICLAGQNFICSGGYGFSHGSNLAASSTSGSSKTSSAQIREFFGDNTWLTLLVCRDSDVD